MDVVKQHLVLSEPPDFTSAGGEPDVAHAVQAFFGWDDPRAVAERLSEIRLGALPAPGGALLRPALADPSQSRAPACLLAVDSTFPDLTLLTDREREAVQASFPPATVRRLRDYAPNVAGHAVARSLVAPLRPVPRRVVIDREGPAHYRAPGIGRLYLAGADSHPGGGIHGACGWNAASVAIADISR
jgi:phytoene dehydrogenase-like protein